MAATLSSSSIEAIYALLHRFGAAHPPTRHSAKGADLKIAWPDVRVALVLPGDVTSGLDKSWHLVQFPVTGSWPAAVEAIRSTAGALTAAISGASATNPSTHEQLMASALHRAGAPSPSRDLRLTDPKSGELVNIPDFAWPEHGVILEVDGWYHHHGRDLDRIQRIARSSGQKHIRQGDQLRVAKDARKRRLLASLGWVVVTVTDTEIDAGAADLVAKQVVEILKSRSTQ